MFNSIGDRVRIGATETDPDAPLQEPAISDLVALPGGGFAVAWRISVSDIATVSTSVYLSVFGGDGTLLADAFPLATSDGSNPPRVYFGGIGVDSFAVFMQLSGTPANYVADYANTGTLLSGLDSILPAVKPEALVSDAVSLANGNSLLIYQDLNNGKMKMHAQYYGDDDKPIGAEIDFSKQSATNQGPGTAVQHSDGRISIAYTAVGKHDAGDIFVYTSGPSGQYFRAAHAVHTRIDGRQFDPAIAALDTGGYAVAWTSENDAGTSIYVRGLEQNGRYMTSAIKVADGHEFAQTDADVVGLSGGRFAVVWEDARNDGTIKAAMYDRLGSQIGKTTTLAEDKQQDTGYHGPRAVEIDNGMLLVSWVDDNGPDGIIAQRFDVGQPGTDAADTLTASTMGRVLDGFGGNDRLVGGTERDLITGGAGKDTMTGGAAEDRFLFLALEDMGNSKTTRDRITDFTRSDRIDLSDIDLIPGGRNDPFQWSGDHIFIGKAGELHYIIKGKTTIVEADLDGDRVADFQIELAGQIDLGRANFIL